MSRLIRMSVLASGSTGNATFVENEKGSLLVDVGLTGKKMEELFSQIDRNIQDLNGILVTHEHIDHIKGLGVLARKYQLPIYANEKTWQAIEKKDSRIPMIRNSFLILMKQNLLQVSMLNRLMCHMMQYIRNFIFSIITIRSLRF